jgi:hypothetical protein
MTKDEEIEQLRARVAELVEERDGLRRLVAAKNDALQSVIDECGNRPFTRMIAIAGLELQAAPQQEQE